jgi:hypothetical protein
MGIPEWEEIAIPEGSRGGLLGLWMFLRAQADFT